MDGCFSSSRRNSNHILTLVDRRRWWTQEIAREGPGGLHWTLLLAVVVAVAVSCELNAAEGMNDGAWRCGLIASWRKLVLSLLLVISMALSSTKTTRLCFWFFGFVSICLFVCCVFERTRRLFFGLLSRFCLFLQSVFSVPLFSDAWVSSK